MTEYKINLLERIFAGGCKYVALGEQISDYEDFIPVARALLELEHDGYLVIKNQQQEERTGRRLYSEFVVDRLTRSGLEVIGKNAKKQI